MKKDAVKLVLWAIDPFEVEQFKAQEDAIRALDSVVDPRTVIQPVFVWGGRPLGAAVRSSQVKRQADLILGRWPKPSLQNRMRGLKVLVAPGTTSVRAEALARYAKRVKCELILASHHTRRTLKRAFIGSFSDSLSLIAETPLLVVPPGAKSLSEQPAILFPTDFSEASMSAFEQVLQLAAVSRSKLTLFHKFEQSMPYAIEFGYAYSTEMTEALLDEARFSLAEMQSRAKQAGIRADTILDEYPGHAGLAIATRAKRGYGMVALAAHRGPWDRFILGSTSRFVLRECPISVWILRSKGRSLVGARRPRRRRGDRAVGAAPEGDRA